MQLQLIPQSTVKETETKTLLESPRGGLSWTHLAPFLKSTLFALQEGAEEESLLKEEAWIPRISLLLEQLKLRGLLTASAPSLFTLSALRGPLHLRDHLNAQDCSFSLSRFCFVRSEKGEMVLETPLSACRIVLQRPEAAALLQALATPRTLEDLFTQFSSISRKAIVDALLLLDSAKALSKEKEESDAVLGQWEFHDLLFHSRTRLGRHANPYGGLYPFREKFPPLPALKAAGSSTEIPLYQPERSSIVPRDFTEVLESRKSQRDYGQTPLTLAQLGEFLFRTARVKSLNCTGPQEISWRLYPSGGALHELEIYPLIYSCTGIEAGLYHYHPKNHSLCKLSDLNPKTERCLRGAAGSMGKSHFPQVLFVLTSRFQRRSWKYASIAYATTLKNVGVLYQTMYLVATAMDLAGCALGGGDADLFSELMGSNYFEETSVGEFALGSPAK